MPELSQQEISDFLSEPHLADLATVRPDGRPHVAPVGYIVENGKAFVIARATAVKVRNVRHNPKVSLSIAPEELPYRYVVLEGEALLTDNDVDKWVERLSVRYYGPERGPTFAREQLAVNKYRLLEVQIQRVISYVSDEKGTPQFAPVPRVTHAKP